ncbi:hypothetical protein NECAME_07997 [Necator americanus]|uniref:Uncharacterized protein n=1 Tax=Necator americanus TaxID=51031 RepID=W2TMX9_NECAM|nr:hypothetical protein NECAME_07997 [Necator americanus]ETN82347.1 hypothetical protein NECAME_07997 [Necator americanus]
MHSQFSVPRHERGDGLRSMQLAMSQMSEEVMYEEEPPPHGPTAEELRLPRNVEPIWYNLTLRTYIPGVSAVENEKNLTTDGNIMIKLKVLSTTEEIVLNAKDLSFPSDPSKVRILKEDVKIEGLNEEEMLNVTNMTPAPVRESPLQLHGSKVERLLYNDTLQKLILTLDKAVQSGEEVIVQLPFKGRITENTGGVRHSWYRTKTGNKK